MDVTVQEGIKMKYMIQAEWGLRLLNSYDIG